MEDETFDLYDSWKNSFWWIWSRRDILKRSLKRLDLGKNSIILDVGAGSGLFYKVLRTFGRVVNLEYSDKGLSHLKKKGITNLVQGDAHKLPFRNSCFDAITCIDVMEHLSNDRMFVKEAHRVLKRGGFLVVTVPAFMFLWSDDDILVHHKRRYTIRALKKLFRGRFSVEKATYRFFFIFLPSFFLFQIKKINKKLRGKRYVLKNSLGYVPHPIINFPLRMLMKLENKLIDLGVSFPFGVNILIVLRKK